MRQALIAAALALSSVTAIAEEPLTSVTIFGHGNSQCGSFLLALERREYNEVVTVQGETFPSEARAYYQWAAGYLAADTIARGIGHGVPASSFDGAWVWLRSYCQANPTTDFMFAVRAFAEAHRAPLATP